MKEEENDAKDVHSSKRVKLSSAVVVCQKPSLGFQQEQDERRDPAESADKMPGHVQKMVDAFYDLNVLNTKNGHCSQILKASEYEANHLGRSIIFVHGRTGDPLEARSCLVRKGEYALVVSGPSLPKSSIIRCHPRETGIRGISAWVVWKGLEGVERNFLIFKFVRTSFTIASGKR